MQKGSKYCW